MIALWWLLSAVCVSTTHAWRQIGGDSGRQTYQSTNVSVPLPVGVGAIFSASVSIPKNQQNDALPSEHNGSVWFTADDARSGSHEHAYIAKAIDGVIQCQVNLTGIVGTVRDLGTPAICSTNETDPLAGIVIVGVLTEVLGINATDCSVVWNAALPLDDPATRTAKDAQTRMLPGAVCDSAHSHVLVQTRHSLHALSIDLGFERFAVPLVDNSTFMEDSPAHGLAPAVCGDWVFATAMRSASQTAFVSAFNATSGDVRWNITLDALVNVTASISHPVVDRACAFVYVATSVGVYEIDAATGALSAPAHLGLCGAMSVQVIEANGTQPALLVTAGDSQFAPLNSTARCVVGDGVMAVELVSGNAVSWSHSGPLLSDAVVVASSERNYFWCEGGTLYGSFEQNSSIVVQLNDFVGCNVALITDDAKIVVNDIGGLTWYTIGVPPPTPPPTPAPPTMSPTPMPTSANTTTDAMTTAGSATTDGSSSSSDSGSSTTDGSTGSSSWETGDSSDTTGFVDHLKFCLTYLTVDCMPHFCPAAINESSWSHVSCEGVKCQLYCLSRPEAGDCKSVLTLVCNPPPPMCDVDCNATYAGQFGGENSTSSQGTHGVSSTPMATDAAPTNSNIWIAVGVSAGVFWIIAMVVIVCCVMKHRQDKNRYVLLELDDDDHEPMP